jgi:septum formation topological specificity factor MinE
MSENKMIKAITSLEVVKGERRYQLILSNDSPLGECFDVLCEMKAHVLSVINQFEAEKEKKAAEQPTEQNEPPTSL